MAHVDSLAPGSGSQFALLPPENATGKLHQDRAGGVPIKILIDPNDPLHDRLRPGLSVAADDRYPGHSRAEAWPTARRRTQSHPRAPAQ